MLGKAVEDDLDQELQQLCVEESRKEQDPELLCPFCGISYLPTEGCFCVRVTDDWSDWT